MKRFGIILIQVFAVIASYLIVSMPFAFGFQVSIFNSGMQEFPTSIPDFAQLIEKDFSYPYRQNIQYIGITLSSKDPGKTIEKVYLYRCKDYNPAQCVQNGILPVISVSPFNATIWFNDETKWSDVKRNGIANFLTLVKMDMGGEEIWTGSWDTVEEAGIGQFAEKNYDLDKLNVYLRPGVQGETAKGHVESKMSIPVGWADHSVLTLVEGSSVSRLYELTGDQEEIDPSGTGTPDFYAGILTGNTFNASFKEWAFVFGGDGKTSNPVAFYRTGEEPSNETEMARLRIDNWSPQAVTCGSSETITVASHVENEEEINCGEDNCYFQDYYYEMEGVRSGAGSVTCSIVNPIESIYEYECSIPVDEFPVCPAPKTSTIKLYFAYKNDVVLSGEFPVTLKRPPPRLIVDSVFPSIFDCNIDTELTANLRVTNPPAGTPGKYYTFDGVNFETMSCTGSWESYVCKIEENEICALLQEDLDIEFKLEYAETDLTSDPVNLHVTFPPPSMGIDTVTPEVFTSGTTTEAQVLLHVNYPDSISYDENDFKYTYLGNPFAPATCSLDNSFSNIKYYQCSVELDIPSGREGVDTLTFRLDGYQGSQPISKSASHFITIKSPPPDPALTIVSTSSPLDCIRDSSLTVQAKSENIQGTPARQYSVDLGQTFDSLTCSGSGNVHTCHIPKDDLCSLLTNSLDLILKFTYGTTELVSNSQKVYVNLPEPHMQVYSVHPNVLIKGQNTQASVNLYIQYPETVGSPKFVYSYLDKSDQSMSCQKVSSTGTRDYYRCSQTSFMIPSDYSGNQVAVLFAVEGTTLTYPFNIPVTSEEEGGAEPWFEIYSTIPGKIEIEAGNSTEAVLSIMVHNAGENDLKHSISLQPTSWITPGTCEEIGDYDFSCGVTFNAPRDANMGENRIEVKARVSDGRTYTLVNHTKVYVMPGEFYLDVQSVTPDKLYCQGHSQQNPQQVRLSARVMNLQADSLLQEKITFNGYEIPHTDRYCTFQSNSITCNIPTDKLLSKVTCGQGDLAPGEGLHYYPVSLMVLLKRGDEQVQVSGVRDLGVESLPLQAYLEIFDDDIENGYLKETINCLDSETIRLGEGGNYVRIRYADLLHQTPDESDLTWSFRLDAYDDRGKLTKGMGVSPTANATICRMKGEAQTVGVHRYEDYECTLFVDRQMFQRCADGEGTIRLTALSRTMGRSAEAEFRVYVNKGEDDFDLYVQVEKEASDEITCWVTGFDGRCQLEYSQLNSTVSVRNRASGDIGDLTMLDSDIQFEGGDIDVDVFSPYCRETAQGSSRFLCGFGIRPAIKIEQEVTNETDQTFRDVDLGNLKFTTLVRYADGLAEDTLSADLGSVTVKPEKDPDFIDYLQQKDKIRGVVDTVKKIVKGVLFVAGFCVTCAAGTWIYREVAGDEGGTKTPSSPGTGGSTGGTGGTSQWGRGTPCVGTSGKAGTCEYSTLCQGTYLVAETPSQSTPCDTGLICCVEKNIFGPEEENDYVPETGIKIGFSPGNLEECIKCVNNEYPYDESVVPQSWCPPNSQYRKCIASHEECSYKISTELSCREYYSGETFGDFRSAYNIPQAITTITREINKEKEKVDKCDSWTCSTVGLLAIMGIFAVVVLGVTGEIKGEGTSEYTKALANGMKIGLVCILLQVLGKWITGEEGEGSKFGDIVGKGMTGFGNILYKACVFLARNFPALISVLTIVMRWMTFQMCVEDIERSLDQGYYGGTTQAEQYRSGLVGSQSALSRLQGCMTQFNQISQDAWMLGQSMVYSGTGLWGTASLKLTGSKSNRELSNGGEICRGEEINFEVKNWCKVIMDSGNDAQYIFITSDGKNCNKVTLYSAETCRAYYGGYGSYGGWSGGLGTGTYRTLYETPGKNSGHFSPLMLCNDGAETAHTYNLINPLRTITITYNPGC